MSQPNVIFIMTDQQRFDTIASLGNEQIFPAFDETQRVGLLYRDLLGAGLAGMWSVDALIAAIGNRRPHFIAGSRLLADRAYRVEQLRAWLTAAQISRNSSTRRRTLARVRSAQATRSPPSTYSITT